MDQQKVQDLQADSNKLHRLFHKFSNESRAISISTVALIVSLLALLMAYMAVHSSNVALAKIDYELQATRSEITELKGQLALTDVYLQRVHVIIESNGLEAPPLPEKK